jgi:putative ABC transport system permease protein
MLLLTGAALAAAVLGVMSTMVASVVDRTQEIALLRAIGATGAAVGRLFLAEALVVALVGGLLGVGIGFALAQIVGRGAFGTAVAPHPLLVPAGLALAALVCLLGAWVPLRRTAAIDPALALKAGA